MHERDVTILVTGRPFFIERFNVAVGSRLLHILISFLFVSNEFRVCTSVDNAAFNDGWLFWDITLPARSRSAQFRGSTSLCPSLRVPARLRLSICAFSTHTVLFERASRVLFSIGNIVKRGKCRGQWGICQNAHVFSARVIFPIFTINYVSHIHDKLTMLNLRASYSGIQNVLCRNARIIVENIE